MKTNGMRAENGFVVEQLIKYEITSQTTEGIALVPTTRGRSNSPGGWGSEI
jgi:hypothetical protein